MWVEYGDIMVDVYVYTFCKELYFNDHFFVN